MGLLCMFQPMRVDAADAPRQANAYLKAKMRLRSAQIVPTPSAAEQGRTQPPISIPAKVTLAITQSRKGVPDYDERRWTMDDGSSSIVHRLSSGQRGSNFRQAILSAHSPA